MNNSSETAQSPLLVSSETDSGSQIQEERTNSTNNSSSLFESSDKIFQPPALRRTTSRKTSIKKEKTSGFMSKIGGVATSLGNTASKRITNFFSEQEEETQQVAQVELTEDQAFVQRLYERVHTQSQLLQTQMTLNIIQQIKERNRREEHPTELSTKLRKWRKSMVPLKWFALCILIILPFFTVPNWCIQAGKQFQDCDPEEYPNSNMSKVKIKTSSSLLIIAYIILGGFIVLRLFIKKRSTSSIIRTVIMCSLMLFCIADLLWVTISENKSTTSIVDIFNVFLILFFVRAIREVWIQFIQVLAVSVPIFAIILAYFIIYTIVGFIMFANHTEDNSFSDLIEALYTVFILFTVSNYPDVQMSYFEENRLSILYFWSFLLIGIFLLSNLLLAQIFLNYKKLIKKKLTKYEQNVKLYFQQLFEALDGEGLGYITVEKFSEALGGESVIERDPRLRDLIWQSNLILDGKIRSTDFSYMLQFTDTVEQQQLQIERIKRYLSKQRKQRAKKEKYEEALQDRKTKMASKRDEQKKTMSMGSNLVMVMPLTEMMEKQKELEIEAELQEEEDDELIELIKKQNSRNLLCFKKKVKKDMAERVESQKVKSKRFTWKLEEQKIDVTRILNAGKQKVVDDYGRVYAPKDHHGKWRRRFIVLQNEFWVEAPMTILGICSLVFIPLFQYCRLLFDQGVADGHQDDITKARRLLLSMLWINYFISVLFGLEVVMKSYAFGLRRAFSTVNWVIKLEYFYQVVIWLFWFIFLFADSEEMYSDQIIVFSMGILLRALRMTALLNEIDLWRNFIRTIAALLRPFFNFSITLYSLYMIYASIGVSAFGGTLSLTRITELAAEDDTIDTTWLYLNFNDYMMALNTLFGIMWQNDWEQFVYMWEVVFDLEKDGAVLIFFITFMQLANLIFVNIIIAFVIDTYQSIDETLQAEIEAKEMNSKKDKHMDTSNQNSILQELNNNPAQFTRIMEILNQRQAGNESMEEEETVYESPDRQLTKKRTSVMDIFLNRSAGHLSQDLKKIDTVQENSSESDKSSGEKESSEDSLKSDESLEEDLKDANLDDHFVVQRKASSVSAFRAQKTFPNEQPTTEPVQADLNEAEKSDFESADSFKEDESFEDNEEVPDKAEDEATPPPQAAINEDEAGNNLQDKTAEEQKIEEEAAEYSGRNLSIGNEQDFY